MKVIKAKDLRQPREKVVVATPCNICNGFNSITEQHHVIPLKDCAAWFDCYGVEVSSPLIWLCPNCHSYVHKYCSAMNKGHTNILYSIKCEVSDEFFKAIHGIWEKRNKLLEDIVKLAKATYGWSQI